MTPITIGVLAVMTYVSRLSGTLLLPAPRGRIYAVLERFPAPLFACLAAAALIDVNGAVAPIPVLTATAGALALARTRSLPLIGLAGVAGYVVGSLLK